MLIQKFANMFFLFLSVKFFMMIAIVSPASLGSTKRKPPSPPRCISKQCDSIARNMWIWLDIRVDPCEDFYKYVCGSNALEPTRFVSNFLERRTQMNHEIADFLRRRNMDREPEALGVARSIYSICLKIDAEFDKMKMLSRIMDVNLHRAHPSSRSREEQCLEMIKSKFDLLFSYLFAKEKKYENATTLAIQISKYVDKSFKTIINQSMWMDEATKMGALNKLASMEYSIGTPYNTDELYELLSKEYNDIYSHIRTLIELKSDQFEILDHLQLNVRSYEMNQMTEYQKNPSQKLKNNILIHRINETGRYYDEINTLSIGIGGLGFPILTDSLKSLDFGRIGVILGREMTNLFDPSRKSQDGWWSKDSSQKYDEKVKCFKQIENRINVTKQNSAEVTIDEDLSDHVGFRAALQAYRIYASEREKEPFLVLFDDTPEEQLFILGFANLFCEHPLPHGYSTKNKNDRYSPAAARVNNVLRNSKDFAKIWNCPVGSNMNPVNKCEFW